MNEREMTLHDRLDDLARNLRWAWHRPTRSLFRRLDAELWERVGHNPVALLRRLDPAAVEAAGVQAEAERLWTDLHDYLAADRTWYDEASSPDREFADRPLTAYFCAEYGLTEALRIYAGGLGILAGDHLKSASDLGVPLVAMGLYYREGYFVQELGPDGGQTEAYPTDELEDLPLREVGHADGSPLRIALLFPGRQVFVRVWRVDVGRVPLFLLDADLPENSTADRALTARLYGGDSETRIAQEILLGMGGYRALREMEVRPRTYHMNEGHSAFLGLELIRERMEADGLEFGDAVEAAAESCVFTTHTPVPAGHDRFSPALMSRYFTHHARGLGIGMDRLMALGREDPEDDEAPFTMTVLAIRLSTRRNGVSRLHGEISREMWHPLWPDRPVDGVPIVHITNGVHLPSWVDHEVADLYGVDPSAVGIDGATPDPDQARLWAVRQRLRRRLVDYIAARTGRTLDPEALTIAFARRFATYKRATLVLSDPERLAALLGHEAGPVQLVFSGKAHPRDEGGKAMISAIDAVSRHPEFRDRIVFLPGYGIDVARQLVTGADVWLNNPRRPMEASGTSGMKAAANGVLNVSILDGWWDEAWRDRDPDGASIGWVLGEAAGAPAGAGRGAARSGLTDRARGRLARRKRAGAAAREEAARDARDAETIFRVLESEVVPTFYARNDDGVPTRWTAMMAASMHAVPTRFNTNRMVGEYVKAYRQAAEAAGSRIG